jgi:hypothetical protein
LTDEAVGGWEGIVSNGPLGRERRELSDANAK